METVIENGSIMLINEDDSIDKSDLRKAFATFPTGVTVVTTLDENKRPRGFTANSFSSVSLTPPLVSVCIALTAASYGTFVKSGHFAISVLSNKQSCVSQLFGSKNPDKFDRTNWHPGKSGMPVIDNCLAHFECKVESDVEAGDHTILIGRVLDFEYRNGQPLAFFGGSYASMSMA